MQPIVVYPSVKMQYFAFVIAGLAIVGIVLFAYQSDQNLYLLLAAPLLLDFWATAKFIVKRFTKMTVGDGKLRMETGVLSRSTRTLDLTKVQDVRADQTFGQRLLGVGDLTVETASESGRLEMPGIDRPQQIAEQILHLAHQRTREVSGGGGRAAEPSGV